MPLISNDWNALLAECVAENAPQTDEYISADPWGPDLPRYVPDSERKPDKFPAFPLPTLPNLLLTPFAAGLAVLVGGLLIDWVLHLLRSTLVF
jgi:hypothetical protein